MFSINTFNSQIYEVRTVSFILQIKSWVLKRFSKLLKVSQIGHDSMIRFQFRFAVFKILALSIIPLLLSLVNGFQKKKNRKGIINYWFIGNIITELKMLTFEDEDGLPSWKVSFLLCVKYWMGGLEPLLEYPPTPILYSWSQRGQ